MLSQESNLIFYKGLIYTRMYFYNFIIAHSYSTIYYTSSRRKEVMMSCTLERYVLDNILYDKSVIFRACHGTLWISRSSHRWGRWLWVGLFASIYLFILYMYNIRYKKFKLNSFTIYLFKVHSNWVYACSGLSLWPGGREINPSKVT